MVALEGSGVLKNNNILKDLYGCVWFYLVATMPLFGGLFAPLPQNPVKLPIGLVEQIRIHFTKISKVNSI